MSKAKWLILVAMAVAFAAGIAMPRFFGGGSLDTNEALQEVRWAFEEGCPKDYSWADFSGGQAQLVDSLQHGLEAELSGPGITQNVAEFQDCQAFISEDVLKQGPGQPPGTFTDGTFAVFAVQQSPDDLPLNPHPDTPYFHEAAEADPPEALPAAQIVASSAYPRMGLVVGFNCLYLYRDPTGSFRAAIRGNERAWEEFDCKSPIPLSEFEEIPQPNPALAVVRGPEGPATDHPVVARWLWDYRGNSRQSRYRVGVWCDQAWCEIGPRPETGGPPTPVPGQAKNIPPEIADLPQFKIPAWQDEQLLSTYDVQNMTLKVSEVIGTIVPDPMLGRYRADAQFAYGNWQPAAWVGLTSLRPRANNPFADKFNFTLTDNSPNDPSWNQIFLCRGEWDGNQSLGVRGCREDGVDPPATCPPELTNDSDKWWAKLVSADGNDTEYRCVSRCGYEFPVPGTARWRWLSDDPGIWMRCLDGCCEVRGGEGESRGE
jgi:hypothetical protein